MKERKKPKTGARRWGHATHSKGLRMLKRLEKTDFFDVTVANERRKYLCH